MKTKILLGCLVAASLLPAASCSDFLTEDPKGKLVPENFYSNQDELNLGVYSLYSLVQAFQANSNPLIVQCQGDDVTSTTGTNKAAYLSADAFEVPSDTKGLDDNWMRLYAIVKTSNMIIDNAPGANASKEEVDIAMGQAYYWRAFSYFNLVRIFGPIPVDLHNVTDNNAVQIVSVENVYAQIVSDLIAAENCNLPAKYTGNYRSIEGQNLYVSQQTVKATLAAVYMAMAGYPLNKTEYYGMAADKAKEVVDGVNNGTYDQSLLRDWENVYSYGMNHHNETLLGIDYNATLGGWSTGDSQLSSCHQLASLEGGWGDFLPERLFWRKYPDGPRKDAVFAKQLLVVVDDKTKKRELVDWWATRDGQPYNGTNAVVTEYRPMYVAFTVNADDAGAPIAAPYDYTKPHWTGMCMNKRHQIIRYSEVLCWFAEASARSGKYLSEARAALKQVRDRAYSDKAKVDEVDALSGDALAEAAYDEHGYEVAGNVVALVTRRADQFRMNRLEEAYNYRAGSQDEILVPAGTLTHSVDDAGNPFTYTTTQDLKLQEEMPITVGWGGESSMYQIYPPKETEKNPNLRR